MARLQSTRLWVLVAGVAVLAGVGAAPAGAARLVGGREQGAIRRAFSALHTARGQVIVSVRSSSVSPAWAIVRSVTPHTASSTGAGAVAPRLSSSFFHRAGAAWRPGAPPPGVRADLTRSFAVAVLYAGSGSETVTYSQTYKSLCAGAGGFTDQQSDVVSPMSWSVRYVVDLDRLLAAQGTAAQPTLVPAVSFDAGRSRLNAHESLTRSFVDAGCNGGTVRRACNVSFRLGGPTPAGQLDLSAASGLAVGIPMRTSSTGDCNPGDYTLGPSLWDSGGTTALAGGLGLLGAHLPANPYAPVHVSWPTQSAQQSRGFAASPCQGDSGACTDQLQWRGTVTLSPLSG